MPSGRVMHASAPRGGASAESIALVDKTIGRRSGWVQRHREKFELVMEGMRLQNKNTKAVTAVAVEKPVDVIFETKLVESIEGGWSIKWACKGADAGLLQEWKYRVVHEKDGGETDGQVVAERRVAVENGQQAGDIAMPLADGGKYRVGLQGLAKPMPGVPTVVLCNTVLKVNIAARMEPYDLVVSEATAQSNDAAFSHKATFKLRGNMEQLDHLEYMVVEEEAELDARRAPCWTLVSQKDAAAGTIYLSSTCVGGTATMPIVLLRALSIDPSGIFFLGPLASLDPALLAMSLAPLDPLPPSSSLPSC